MCGRGGGGNYHVGAEAGAGHGGEVGRAGVILAAAYNGDSTHLAWFGVSWVKYSSGKLGTGIPLWNFSSIGGTIFFALRSSSLVA